MIEYTQYAILFISPHLIAYWTVTAIIGDFSPSVRPAKPPLLNGKGNLRERLNTYAFKENSGHIKSYSRRGVASSVQLLAVCVYMAPISAI